MHVQVLDLSGLSPEESKHQIVDYLSEQIATIFSMPKEDIDIDRSLQRMGMDSLMALVLMRVIETGFGVAYSVQDILKGPSIIEIADKILSQGKQSEIERPVQVSNVWITYRVKRLHPKIRLFCFPYGGGGGSIYRDWHNALPDEIEVCPIQLPAREERMDEEAIVDIDTLIDRLIQNLKLEFDLPFAFFGHSFGSLIGFALTRYLRNHRMPLPVHLFASAYPDPKIPTKSLNKLLEQLKTIGLTLFNLDSNELAALSDEKLMELAAIFNENGVFEYGNHLITPDIVRLLVPTFIGDMRIVKSYFYRDESPFDLPISVFLGQKDTWISYADHLGWAAHTRKQCRVYDFNSGHLFIKDPQCKKEMLNIIANTLAVAVNIPLA